MGTQPPSLNVPIRTVPIGDPVALARAIDSAMGAVPNGQHGRLLLNLTPDRQSLGVVWKVGNHVSTLLRIEKERGKGVGGDLSVGVTFAKSPDEKPEAFTWNDLYEALSVKGRKLESAFAALHLMVGREHELAEIEIL